MTLDFTPLDAGALDDVRAFLAAHEWPFHGTTRLTPEQAAEVSLVGDDMACFWISDGDHRVGLIRVWDLDDVDDGSPMFDIRLAADARGRGMGRAAVDWITDHLFATHPGLQRIEATTRHDNVAMQRVFAACGYRQEGRMVEAWVQADSRRFDSLTYAVLRRERTERAERPPGPELFAAAPNVARPRRPIGRVIVPPDRDPCGPAFFEWELHGQEWSDEHPHDEWVYVLEGELTVEADGVAVAAGPGALVRVPSGSRGTYRAERFARLLSVYGPRPHETGDPYGRLRRLGPD